MLIPLRSFALNNFAASNLLYHGRDRNRVNSTPSMVRIEEPRFRGSYLQGVLCHYQTGGAAMRFTDSKINSRTPLAMLIEVGMSFDLNIGMVGDPVCADDARLLLR
jgi:hypothetical protein